MTGTSERPLRVAVVGAGPAGFYTVEALLKREKDGLIADVDLIEKLPAPYGLLRYGVAPDHPKIKGVAAAWDRIAEHPRVRYLGNVAVGLGAIGVGATGAVTVEELFGCYDQVVFSTGCATDRRLGIPGEDLPGSHSATSFVAWYNGHPEFVDLPVDLDVERAVVIGIGDVAMDLARMLLRDPEELVGTDIAVHALEALRRSRVREVVILARRGPRESAFAAKELEDIGNLAGIGVEIDHKLVEHDLDPSDARSGVERHKLEVLAALAAADTSAEPRRLELRFLVSPVEILSNGEAVRALRVERNELVFSAEGKPVARATGDIVEIEAGLVLRAVGYRGVPLPGLPFDETAGTVPNVDGRVTIEGRVVPRLYVAGWIKRGATGVVGTNKADAAATVAKMVEDLASLPRRSARTVARESIDALLAKRAIRVVSWEAWKRIDQRERELGAEAGSSRRKLTVVEELLRAGDC